MKKILLVLVLLTMVINAEPDSTSNWESLLSGWRDYAELRVDNGTQLNFCISGKTEIVVTDSMILEMTEEEFENFTVLYIYVSSISSTDSISVDFFSREKTISYGRCFEIMCKKLIPEWVFERNKGE